MEWFEERGGFTADTTIGLYMIDRPKPGSRHYVVRFKGVRISGQLHNKLDAAKLEAQAHYVKGSTP